MDKRSPSGDELLRKRLALCRDAVKGLPELVRDYCADRYRERYTEYHAPAPDDAALEIYMYAFQRGESPKRFGDLIGPILVALRLAVSE